MQKVVILTSSYSGTAAHHLPYLMESKCCEIAMVVVSQGQSINWKKKIKRIFKKVAKIGVLGALNGIRMRKWYGKLADQYTRIGDLRELCRENNIELHSVSMINCKETVELFRKADADLGISLGNGYISSKVFNTPKMGMINIHHELLPEYQNAQSIIWQFYNNSDITGYTIHRIDKNIDTGDILIKEEVPIKLNDTLAITVAETSSLLLKASAKGLVYVLSNMKKVFSEAKKQGEGNKYTTPSFRQFLRIWRNYNNLKKAKAL